MPRRRAGCKLEWLLSVRTAIVPKPTWALLIGVGLAVALEAQTTSDAASPPNHAAVPIRRSWNAIRAGDPYAPMTGQDRLNFLFRRAVASPGAPVRMSLQAALDQRANDPPEWGQGADAYGRRMLFHFARSGVRNLVESGSAAALGYDQRYIRASHGRGAMRRFGHALAMNFVTYDRHGHWAPNLPRIGSTVAADAVALQWLPSGSRSSRQMARSLGISIGTGALTNVWREFSPDVMRRLPFRK